MDSLLKGSSTIRTSVSADIFDAKNDVAHHHKEYSYNDGKNDGSTVVTSTPPHASKSKVATNTPKMSILFNQSEDIKVDYFGKFECVDSQRAHQETFGNNPMLFPDIPTNHNKPRQRNNYMRYLNSACLTYLFILLEIFILLHIMFMIQGAHMMCAKQL